VKNILIFGLLSVGCSSDYPTSLVKVYSEDCWHLKAGESFVLAKVESFRLCESLALTNNLARLDPEQRAGDFGLCRNRYYFACRD